MGGRGPGVADTGAPGRGLYTVVITGGGYRVISELQHDQFVYIEGSDYFSVTPGVTEGLFTSPVADMFRWKFPDASAATWGRFVDSISEIPEVSRVYLDDASDEVTHIWTFLDREPFESAPRYRVYDVEEKAREKLEGQDLEFHLINTAEYPEGTVPDRAPGAVLLFERPDGE